MIPINWMEPMTQQEFDFDMATLNACISRIVPKRKKTVFRGLLFAAANEPRLVDAIDAQGFVLMTAPIDKIAAWANVTPRAIRINVDRVRAEEPGVLEQSTTVNTAAVWMFRIGSVLPESAVQWFIDLVENVKSSPRTFQKFTLNFSKVHPELSTARGELPTKVHPEVQGELLVCTSTCSFYLNTASLAKLAENLSSLGIAATANGDDFRKFRCDPIALDTASAVSAIADCLAANPTSRRQIFLAAAIARSKEIPWSWFRAAIADAYQLTPTRQQSEFAGVLERSARNCDATELLPRMPVDQAWQKLRTTMASIDYLHQSEKLREALGSELHAAARAVGISRIANSNPSFQTELRNAFAAAWHDQALAAIK